MDTLKLYQRTTKLPGGHWAFSRAVSAVAPYFASIGAHFEDLRPGYARIRMRNRRAVRNHLGSVHAIAMCNMAELAGGTMTDVSIASGARWIPVGMQVRYLKKARTDLVAEALGESIDWSCDGEVSVPVEVRDSAGDLVFTAQIQMSLRQQAAA